MRVLVVDDEYYARKALLKILGDLDVEVASDLETGREALEFLERDPEIDAVVTDIRMPEMDGLRLSEEMRGKYPEVAVVIVTGYADFHYAQQAIQYGVRDYITKPVRREDLKRALENIRRVREREEEKIRGRIQENVFEASKEALSIRELSRNQDLRERFMGQATRWGEAMPYRVLILQTDPESTLAQREQIRAWLAAEAGTEYKEIFYFLDNREYVLLAYFPEEDGPAGGSLHCLTRCANVTLSRAADTLGLSGSAAIGRSHRGEEELYNAYKEAVYAINQRLLQGWGRVYVYEAGQGGSGFDFPDEEAALRDALDRMDYETAKAVVERVLDDPELCRNGNIYDLYQQIIRILGVLSRHYNGSSDQEGSERMKLLFSRRYDLYNFRHMDELKAYLLGIIQEICCQARSDAENGDIIGEIVDYIRRNYQYDITLQELAEKKYFMNASYLSRLFKAKCGKTFSKYLIEFRLEKSRELLEKTILKVSDIAAHVGYNDVSHYIQSFRKVYGITPEQYRGQLQKTEL